MRTYVYREQQDDDIAEDESLAGLETRQTSSCNVILASAAYNWDNALKIATERMWGDQAPLHRTLARNQQGAAEET